MKNLIEYVYTCTNAMYNYLNNSDLSLLLSELKRCEQHYLDTNQITETDKSLWFKFGVDYTLVTTIKDIENDLSLPSNHANHKFMLECFEVVTMDISPNNELQVYFS